MAEDEGVRVLPHVPAIETFTPLAEYQSTTPESFSATPVLHARFDNAHLVVCRGDLVRYAELAVFDNASTVNAAHLSEEERAGKVTIPHVSGYVTSDSFLLFSTSDTTQRCLSVTYPSIALFATQDVTRLTSEPVTYRAGASDGPRVDLAHFKGLYAQLDSKFLTDRQEGDDAQLDDSGMMSPLELLIVLPSPVTDTATQGLTNGDCAPTTSNEAETKAVYEALIACNELHPDPDDMDEVGGDFDVALNLGMLGVEGGSIPSGWITAENAHQFDPEADVSGGTRPFGASNDQALPALPETLGPGAGTRRTRDPVDVGSSEPVRDSAAGDPGEDEDTKWQRTD